MKKGFTLVEVLVIIAILLVVGLLIIAKHGPNDAAFDSFMLSKPIKVVSKGITDDGCYVILQNSIGETARVGVSNEWYISTPQNSYVDSVDRTFSEMNRH